MKNLVTAIVVLTLMVGAANAAITPYTYDGSQAAAGTMTSSLFDSLDGTWDHYNGEDNWDGLGIGSGVGSSGGVETMTDGADTFLRLQSTTSGNNRKLYFNHAIDGATDTFLDEGVTFSFRARISTTGEIDQIDSGSWPAEGIGQGVFFNGCGMVSLKQASGSYVYNGTTYNYGSQIGFGLIHAGEKGRYGSAAGLDAYPETGDYLVMNNLVGTEMSYLVPVDSEDSTGYVSRNYVPITSATEWNTFEITIVADPDGIGTHLVSVVANGVDAGSFHVTAGYNSRYNGNMVTMGANSPWLTAYDVDYITIPEPATLVLLGLGGLVLRRRK